MLFQDGQIPSRVEVVDGETNLNASPTSGEVDLSALSHPSSSTVEQEHSRPVVFAYRENESFSSHLPQVAMRLRGQGYQVREVEFSKHIPEDRIQQELSKHEDSFKDAIVFTDKTVRRAWDNASFDSELSPQSIDDFFHHATVELTNDEFGLDLGFRAPRSTSAVQGDDFVTESGMVFKTHFRRAFRESTPDHIVIFTPALQDHLPFDQASHKKSPQEWIKEWLIDAGYPEERISITDFDPNRPEEELLNEIVEFMDFESVWFIGDRHFLRKAVLLRQMEKLYPEDEYDGEGSNAGFSPSAPGNDRRPERDDEYGPCDIYLGLASEGFVDDSRGDDFPDPTDYSSFSDMPSYRGDSVPQTGISADEDHFEDELSQEHFHQSTKAFQWDMVKLALGIEQVGHDDPESASPVYLPLPIEEMFPNMIEQGLIPYGKFNDPEEFDILVAQDVEDAVSRIERLRCIQRDLGGLDGEPRSAED